MIQKILILGSVLAMAGSAQAATINVSLQGKGVETVRAELMKAAKEVCKHPTDVLSNPDDYWDCVEDTYGAALRQLKAAMDAKAVSPTDKVASR